MKLTKITPRGFCKGVVDAYAQCKKIAKMYPNNKKYLIGWLVHNKKIIQELEQLGIETKDDSENSRDDIIDSIHIDSSSLKPVVIFSAHGTDKRIIDKARNKGFIVLDTTCKFVTLTHDLIKEKISKGYQIIYIGVKNHPETISTLSIDKNIILIENENEVDKIEDNSLPFFVTNQTTISVYEFDNITKALVKKIKNIEFKNDICNAAKERQDAIINLPDDVDLLIVIGDQKSNNSKKLVDLGKARQIESHLVWDVSEINMDWFKNKNHLAITSGCSTPTWFTNYVIIFLMKKLGIKND